MNTGQRYSFTQSESYEPEYIAILQVAQSQGIKLPNATQRSHQNIFLKGLKENNLWNKLDELYVSMGFSDFEFDIINWKNPYQSLIIDPVLHYKTDGDFNVSLKQGLTHGSLISPLKWNTTDRQISGDKLSFNIFSSNNGNEEAINSNLRHLKTVGDNEVLVRVQNTNMEVNINNSNKGSIAVSAGFQDYPTVNRIWTRNNDDVIRYYEDGIEYYTTSRPENNFSNSPDKEMGYLTFTNGTGTATIYFDIISAGVLVDPSDILIYNNLFYTMQNAIKTI